VGTTNGLDRFRERAVYMISSKQGLIPPVGSVLSARDGSLWIGAVSGLYNWNQGRMTVYRATAVAPIQSVATRDRPLGFAANEATENVVPQLPSNEIECLFEDSRGRIWISTHYGVARFEKGSFTRATGLPNESAIAIFADPHEGVWISYPAAGLFHVVEDRVIETVPWPWTEQVPARQLTAVAAESTTGALWLGFLDGQIAFFKDGQVKMSLGRQEGLGSGTVWKLDIDHEGTLWAATTAGLSRVKDGRVKTLTTKNGLSCDAVDWVMEGEDASLWLHSECGLLRLERSELNAWASDPTRSIHPTVFDRNDGVSSRNLINRFNSVVTRSVDGQLSFVRSDGISFINVLKPRINQVPPPVHIEQISADGRTYSPTSELRLPPRLRDLSIYYTALSLVAPEKVRFRFKLEGQDRDWREVINVRDVQYSNLDPGSYRFRVVAANNNGVWNQEGASLDFSIEPAYWQTNWFRALCAVAIVAVLLALYRLRLRQVAWKLERSLNVRVDERTRIARELHDTLLQSFNGLLLRFQTVLDLLPTRSIEAREILAGAIDQANKAITEGREAVEGLRSSTQESNDLVLAIRSLGEEFAADDTIERLIDFRVDVEGAPRVMHPIFRDELYRIASEAVRNAFRHSHGTKIEVELHYDDRELRLRVRDNGTGIDVKALADDARPGHYGLRGMHERAELIGGKLTVWSAVAAGTEIEFRVSSSRAYAASRSLRTRGPLKHWARRHKRSSV
jgi:signal transduction histidine kinase